MLKRFFISFFGTLAALWLSLIIIIFGFFMLIGSAFADSAGKIEVKRHSVLYLNLSEEITERRAPLKFDDILQGKNRKQSLEDILTAIRRSADDKCIEGIFIDCNGASAGIATHEEILEALKEFKKSNKWIYAYADNMYQGDYFIAQAADSLVLNPVGSLNLSGLASYTPFFKGLMDKMGVRAEVFKVGTYKSAVEPFILEEMSEPARRQTQIFIDSIWNYFTDEIAVSRNVSSSEVKGWADSIITFWPSEKVYQAKAVTGLNYRRIAEKSLKQLSSIKENEDLKLVTPEEYLAAREILKEFEDMEKKEHVAVLYAVGDIVESGNEYTEIASSNMVPAILELADDDNVKGLVLRVNSGGGSAYASEQIWEALEYFKSQGKPYYVSMGDFAASGGYYISCGADKIFADHTTLTGSIGVFGMAMDFSGLEKKLGLNFSFVESNPNALIMNPLRPMSPQQCAAVQSSVENIYDLFTSRVAKGRNMSQDSVKTIAEGRVWVGSSAIGIGLVDEIGTLETAIKAMCEATGTDRSDVRSYPQIKLTIWDSMGEDMMNGNIKVLSALKSIEDIKDRLYINKLRKMNGMQARMPEYIIR